MSAVRTTSRLVAALLGAALLLGVAAPPADAQDPYGSTTTTAPPTREVEASCGLSVGSGRPGDSVTATVRGVFLGENVRIFFDGIQVAATTAPSVASASATTTSVTVTFTVPNAAPGIHILTAVGDTFSAFCNPSGEFRVLGAAKSPRSLPRTGVYVALYLVLAAILLGIGSELVLRARRRRARLLATAHEDDDLYSSAGR